MTEPLFDRRALLDHFDGDAGLFHEMIRIFIDDGDHRRAQIVAALDEQDADALRRQAHGLRGVLGVLRAHTVAAAAGELEECAETDPADWRRLMSSTSNLLQLYDRLVSQLQQPSNGP